MIWQLDVLLLVALVATAVIALRTRDLLVAVVLLSGYSFLMALLFSGLGAVDVALTEVSLGAGLTGVLFVQAVYRTRRRSAD